MSWIINKKTKNRDTKSTSTFAGEIKKVMLDWQKRSPVAQAFAPEGAPAGWTVDETPSLC
jgi:hypothetical protein